VPSGKIGGRTRLEESKCLNSYEAEVVGRAMRLLRDGLGPRGATPPCTTVVRDDGWLLIAQDAQMFVVQNQLRPAAIQDALRDLMRDGLSRVRVCSAYLSLMGSRLLLDAIERNAPDNDLGSVCKTVVTSLDFGLTEPAALRMWRDGQADVYVAGTAALDRGALMPEVAFHPKFYVFDRPDCTVACLVTSANLTRRGLTINSEVGWSVVTADADSTNRAWRAAVELAVPLTDDILQRYEGRRRKRQTSAGHRADDTTDMAPVPQPLPVDPQMAFDDATATIDAGQHGQMWVQSFEMSGGSHTQLEMPRGAHRFFGVATVDYEAENVQAIAQPTLVAGSREWKHRPLRWHGHNQMERINLPSAADGGFNYAQSMILFRRLHTNRYELHVHPWNSDTAHACLEASRQRGLLFRVGQTTQRLAGLIE